MGLIFGSCNAACEKSPAQTSGPARRPGTCFSWKCNWGLNSQTSEGSGFRVGDWIWDRNMEALGPGPLPSALDSVSHPLKFQVTQILLKGASN